MKDAGFFGTKAKSMSYRLIGVHFNKVGFFLIPNLMEYKPLNLLDSIFQTKKMDINKIRQL